ncbi:MAG TPA: hypothetical protein VET51_00605 [Burkholderiales bacterium]|nr:hypothetical protein [Burkholderiales bacterium]
MKWDNLLVLPLVGFIVWPLAALVPAALFGYGYYLKRKPFVAITALLWAAYAVYESLMKARILCSGECNIRVDLLLIIPLLWIVSIVAVVQLCRRKRPDGAA